jgi:hypothetical protein
MSSETPRKNSITIFVVIHDDVPSSKRTTIYEDYFLHLKTELESFIERDVHIIFGSGKPYSSFDYKNEDGLKVLIRWGKEGVKYLDEARKEGFVTNPLTKVVLVTNEPINEKLSGIALIDRVTNAGSFAIASLTNYLIPAHEVGHLLGAKHEDFEVQYNGWWGETYMTPQPHPLSSNIYHFSSANRLNIKNHLANKA